MEAEDRIPHDRTYDRDTRPRPGAACAGSVLSRILLAVVAIAPLAACQTRPGTARAGRRFGLVHRRPSPTSPSTSRWSTPSGSIPKYRRQQVSYNGPEQPGTIVVDIDKRQLVLVQADGTAMQYGVGVGKAGFSWKGEARVGRKGVWPDWSPTTTMVSLNPDLPRTRKGGLDNPARRPRALPLPGQPGHPVPHPRHQRALEHRRAIVVRLRPDAQRGHRRPLRARPGGDPRPGQAQRQVPDLRRRPLGRGGAALAARRARCADAVIIPGRLGPDARMIPTDDHRGPGAARNAFASPTR